MKKQNLVECEIDLTDLDNMKLACGNCEREATQTVGDKNRCDRCAEL